MTFSYLNYSDDYDLDITVSDTTLGKKFIFNEQRIKIESKIKVRGSIIAPYQYCLKVIGKTFSTVQLLCSYHGSIGITNMNNIKGSLINQTSTQYGVKGTLKLSVSEKVLVKGKKDYTSLIGVLNKYISNTESSIIEGYTKIITSYPFK